jgi:4'-phosphopantetheinyl transferase
MNETAFKESRSASFDIHNGDVHVWCVSLDDLSPLTGSLAQYLSEDEQARAGRFVFERGRDRYIASRGALRVILARCLSKDPAQLLFSYNRYGKPQMDASREEPAIRFNVSHAHELALYAVARDRKVGIDIECITRDVAYEQIVEEFFSSREKSTFHNLPNAGRREWFFACWTIKEAYVKAVGTGLVDPLDRIEVTLHPETTTASLNISGEPEEGYRWSVQLLKPAAGYIGAVVTEAGPWRLKCWRWRSELVPPPALFLGTAERKPERAYTASDAYSTA